MAMGASEVRIGEVVRALEGPLAPIACASKNFYRRCDDCPDEERCAVHMLTVDVRNAIADVMDNTTLSDMLERLHALAEGSASRRPSARRLPVRKRSRRTELRQDT
jgi:DNA-binding IscR family transcriptional regulator